jgi:DNA-binding MarR family transcriptional regulator
MSTTMSPSSAELLTAVRSLFTCTRTVRSWVTDAGQTTVLGVLADLGEARVGTVATALSLDVSTVSRTLSALCKQDLVQWRADERDARSHLVSCTPAGLVRLEQRRAQMAAELDRRLADWSTADVTELSNLLHRFVSSLLTEPAGPTSSPFTSTLQETA